MLMPNKHIRVAESILGLSAYLLSLLKEPASLDDVWIKFQKTNNTPSFPAHQGFDNFVLAMDLLYTIGAIETDQKGRIVRASS
jgi:hypothetical protein